MKKTTTKKSNKKKKLLGTAAVLALLAGVAGTFAWQTFQDQKLNRVKAAEVVSDAVKITEDWSKTPITPGGSATKDVKVTNAGDVQVFVRASFEEVMKHLASQGKETEQDKPTEYNSDSAKLTDDIAVPYAGDNATLTAQGWTNVTGNTTGLPTISDPLTGDVQVWATGAATPNPVTPSQIQYSFEYKVFYHYKIGTTDYYQKMGADVSHDGKAAAGATVDTWNISLANPKYYVYKGGYEYLTANWAKSNLVSQYAPSGTTNPTDTTLIGYSGTNNGETFDYTTTAGVPAPTAISTYSTTLPTTGAKLGIHTDTAAAFGGTKGEITITYGSMTDTTALAADNWVYNSEDGWFYYLAKLDTSYSASGVAGTTNSLIKSLNYGSTNDGRYQNVTFDLTAKIEAVQANDKAALEEVFGIDPSSAGTETMKIYNKLTGL